MRTEEDIMEEVLFDIIEIMISRDFVGKRPIIYEEFGDLEEIGDANDFEIACMTQISKLNKEEAIESAGNDSSQLYQDNNLDRLGQLRIRRMKEAVAVISLKRDYVVNLILMSFKRRKLPADEVILLPDQKVYRKLGMEKNIHETLQ